jgi:hypothetical protein
MSPSLTCGNYASSLDRELVRYTLSQPGLRSPIPSLQVATSRAAGEGSDTPQTAQTNRPQAPPEAGGVGFPCPLRKNSPGAQPGPRRHPPAAPDRAPTTPLRVPPTQPAVRLRPERNR